MRIITEWGSCRRALISNARKGIVSEEVLERKQKRGCSEHTSHHTGTKTPQSLTLFSKSLLAEVQHIDSKRFLEIVDPALAGNELAWISNIARTTYLELRLQVHRHHVGESIESGDLPRCARHKSSMLESRAHGIFAWKYQTERSTVCISRSHRSCLSPRHPRQSKASRKVMA